MVPWQTPPQSNALRGRFSLRATRRANRWFLVSVSTPCSGWWKLRIRCGLIVAQEPHHRPGLRLRRRPRAGLVAAVEVGPAVGEVAVEVDAVGVLAGAAGEPVGVVGRDHPQVDAADRPAVAQRQQDLPGVPLVAVHGRDQQHLRRLPGSPSRKAVIGAAAHRAGRSTRLSTTAPGGRSARGRGVDAGGAAASDGERDGGEASRPRASRARERMHDRSHRGGEVGPGEDADADEHADVGQDREPGPVGPGVRRARRRRACRGWAASAPGSAGRRSPSTHQNARATMPTSGAAERRVLGRRPGTTTQITSARTPATVCTLTRPRPDLEPAGAAAVAAEPQPGQHDDHGRQRGQDVDDHLGRHGAKCALVVGSSPRPLRAAAFAFGASRRRPASSSLASRSSSASTSDIR